MKADDNKLPGDSANNELEPPADELVERLRVVMEHVFVPAGIEQLKPEELHAVKEFTCQLPISKGLNPFFLHFLHRIVASQFVGGEATTTVSWPMLVQKWTDICTALNRSHFVGGLSQLLAECFEPATIRVIGLIEMEWDADHRQIVLRSHPPNYKRMTDYLRQTFNIEVKATAHHPTTQTA